MIQGQGVKVCPICRRQDYEKKRYIHAHRNFAIGSAIRIQRQYRGFICRIRLYDKLIGAGYKASSVLFRRRLMFYKLSKITNKIQRNVNNGSKNVQNTVDELNRNYQEKKVIMQDQINQIQTIKQINHQQGIEALENPVQTQQEQQLQEQVKLSQDDWAKIKEKALKRCDKDCIICYQPLQSKKGVYLLSCSHFFHAACINAFERYSVKSFQTCPVCRQEYQKLHMLFK